jgi:hypothetical protein
MPRQVPGSQAIHNPVVRNKTIESGDTPPTQSPERVMKSEGPAQESMPAESVIQVTDRIGDPEKAAMLRFLAEEIDIRIATSTEKDAEQIIEFGINGRIYSFRRGVVKTVPRFVADKIARTKITGYSQREVVNSEGVRQIVQIPHTGQRYDFAVLRDPNPLGENWLKSVLAERG